MPFSHPIPVGSGPDSPDGSPDGTPIESVHVSDSRREATANEASLSDRDIALLLHLAQCRVLTFDQIGALVFFGRHPSIIGRRLNRLARGGWLDRWYEPVHSGGHPGYAMLTARGSRWAEMQIRAHIEGKLWAPLVTRMLPDSGRRRLILPPHRIPPFLAHQRQVNALLVAWYTRGTTPLLWASSWDCPFPTSATSGVPWPQPDFVMVREADGKPEIILGELDRGHEPVAVFVDRKVVPYTLLMATPEVLDSCFGTAQVRVWIAVLDVHRRRPEERLRRLAQAATDHGGGPILEFALAGRIYAHPEDSAWTFADTIVSRQESGPDAIEFPPVSPRP